MSIDFEYYLGNPESRALALDVFLDDKNRELSEYELDWILKVMILDGYASDLFLLVAKKLINFGDKAKFIWAKYYISYRLAVEFRTFLFQQKTLHKNPYDFLNFLYFLKNYIILTGSYSDILNVFLEVSNCFSLENLNVRHEVEILLRDTGRYNLNDYSNNGLIVLDDDSLVSTKENDSLPLYFYDTSPYVVANVSIKTISDNLVESVSLVNIHRKSPRFFVLNSGSLICGINDYFLKVGKYIPLSISPVSVSSGNYFPPSSSVFKESFFEIVYCAPNLADRGFFNFILNEIFSFLNWVIQGASGVYLVCEKNTRLVDFISLFVVHDLNVHVCSPGEVVSAKKIIVSKNEGRQINQDSLNVLQNIYAYLSIEDDGPEYVYISRSRSSQRKLLNEVELEGIFRGKGFAVVFLESLTLNEQIKIFRRAKVIVAPHGAGLTNLVFCKNLQYLIEIFPSNYIVDGFLNVSELLNAKYLRFVGGDLAGPDNNVSWSVDANLLIEAVDKFTLDKKYA